MPVAEGVRLLVLFRHILLRCVVAQRWHRPLQLPLESQNQLASFTARESTLEASSSFKSAVSGSSVEADLDIMTWESQSYVCAGCQVLWHLWMHINEVKSC